MNMQLRDTFGRSIDYIRVSVTDRCNLRCIYCVPSGAHPSCLEAHGPMAAEKLLWFLKAAKKYGLRKVRLTGGEPLLRPDIAGLIRAIRDIGVEDLSLTTNGQLLTHSAVGLKDSGLDRVNISLDSLRPERYRRITGGGSLLPVLRAIGKARRCGLSPVKINMVPVKGINDDEIAGFAKLAADRDVHVRFIELMPVGRRGAAMKNFDRLRVTAEEAKKAASGAGRLIPLGRSGSSDNYRLSGGRGTIGFISPISDHFCDSCNRLRLTAAGRIRPCLFSDYEVDISGASNEDEMERLLLLSVHRKAKGSLLEGAVPGEAMSLIGG